MPNHIDRLKALAGSSNSEQAKYKVYAKATYFLDFNRIYIPNTPYDKLLPGFEAHTKLTRKGSLKLSSEDDTERSLRRTKKAIRGFVFANKFDLFPTFTMKSNRSDVTASKTKMCNWIKNQQKRKGNFQYLIVPEFHEDKQALHFHSVFAGYSAELVEATNPHTGKKLKQKGRQVYNIPSFTLGFTNVMKIDDDPESYQKVASYISKYITKDMPMIFGQHRYWASAGLLVPETEDNPDPWYLEDEPIRFFESENGLTFDFPLRKRAG